MFLGARAEGPVCVAGACVWGAADVQCGVRGHPHQQQCAAARWVAGAWGGDGQGEGGGSEVPAEWAAAGSFRRRDERPRAYMYNFRSALHITPPSYHTSKLPHNKICTCPVLCLTLSRAAAAAGPRAAPQRQPAAARDWPRAIHATATSTECLLLPLTPARPLPLPLPLPLLPRALPLARSRRPGSRRARRWVTRREPPRAPRRKARSPPPLLRSCRSCGSCAWVRRLCSRSWRL